jgi:hypothetical protein
MTVSPPASGAPDGRRALRDGVRPAVEGRGEGEVQRPRRLAPQAGVTDHLGLYPIVTFQYSSTTLYQVSYHI